MKTHTEAINEATGYSRREEAEDYAERHPIEVRKEQPYSAATVAAAEERLRIGNTPDDEDEEYDEEAIEQAAEGIASGQPFTLEEGEKQMYVSPARQS